MNIYSRCIPAVLFAALATAAAAQSAPTLLVDLDHRPMQYLDGDWHYIVDPYATGLYTFHRELKPNGYFQDLDSSKSGAGPIEYDFAKSPTIKVPGDWNTQADRLYYY